MKTDISTFESLIDRLFSITSKIEELIDYKEGIMADSEIKLIINEYENIINSFDKILSSDDLSKYISNIDKKITKTETIRKSLPYIPVDKDLNTSQLWHAKASLNEGIGDINQLCNSIKSDLYNNPPYRVVELLRTQTSTKLIKKLKERTEKIKEQSELYDKIMPLIIHESKKLQQYVGMLEQLRENTKQEEKKINIDAFPNVVNSKILVSTGLVILTVLLSGFSAIESHTEDNKYEDTVPYILIGLIVISFIMIFSGTYLMIQNDRNRYQRYIELFPSLIENKGKKKSRWKFWMRN